MTLVAVGGLGRSIGRRQMNSEYPKATEYITAVVQEIAPHATANLRPDCTLTIEVGGENAQVRFSEDLIDDFEIALQRYRSTSYFHTMQNRVRFPILLALGSKGLTPQFKISAALLEEKGEWLKTSRADVVLSSDLTKILDQGLELLSASMAAMLSSGLKLPDIEADRQLVESLRRYYAQTGTLDSRGVSLQSLSFLKAAAIDAVMQKEAAKAAEPRPRLRKAMDEEIYRVVAALREAPFADVKLPDIMQDFAIAQGLAPTTKTPVYHREASPDAEQLRLDELLRKLDPRLVRRRQGAWEAMRSTNPDRLSQAANSNSCPRMRVICSSGSFA